MLAIHLFFLATEEYYDMIGNNNNILCDNMGAFYTFQQQSKWVPSGAKNSDVKRLLHQVLNRMKSLHLHHHVKAHQDNYTHCSRLSLNS